MKKKLPIKKKRKVKKVNVPVKPPQKIEEILAYRRSCVGLRVTSTSHWMTSNQFLLIVNWFTNYFDCFHVEVTGVNVVITIPMQREYKENMLNV